MNKSLKIFSLSVVIVAGLLLFILFIYKWSYVTEIKNQTAQVANIPSVEEKNQNLEEKNTSIVFVGDIMLDRGVESSVTKNFNGDYNRLFDNLSELKEADILFGNLEGDISLLGNDTGSKYSFRMDPKVIPTLKSAGFDIVSFANNHVGDWNMKAFLDTQESLYENNILKTGAGINKEEASAPTIIEKNGLKFGFLGFSDVGPDWIKAKEKTPGILLANDPDFEQIIAKAKTKCDILIISIHWGIEYKTTHNSRQEYLAHKAIDNGTDLIIGHHPHVMEDIEEYKGKPIVYSLGNFIFDQYFSKDTMRGMVFGATYMGKNLIKTEQKIITLNKKYQPEGIFSLDEMKQKDMSIHNNCPKPKKDYGDMSMYNIGKNNPLPDMTYIPSGMEELDKNFSTKSGVCLTHEVYDAFLNMIKKANEEGYNIKASSGFRSYETQNMLINNAKASGKKDTAVSLAMPGHSEHQLGTTVDVTSSSINFESASGNFYKTEESKWLKENAYIYGFIQSYPAGKEDITGYKSEPWHYRYVGIEEAKIVKDSGLTLVEYLK